jgi:uncharacterized protein YdaU (DUF1376 family)
MRGITATLSPAAAGAYLRILLDYLDRQGPLPDDEKLLRRITGVSRRDWPDVRDELLDVFDLVNGQLTDEYAEKSIEEFRTKSKRGKANARKRFEVVPGHLEDVPE